MKTWGQVTRKRAFASGLASVAGAGFLLLLDRAVPDVSGWLLYGPLGVLAVVCTVSFLVAFRSPQEEEDVVSDKDEPSVTLHVENSPGAITAGRDINISAIPKPSVRGQLIAENQPEGNVYVTLLRLEIEAGYAAQRLAIVATGNSISDLAMYSSDQAGRGVRTLSASGVVRSVTQNRAHFSMAGPVASGYDVEIRTSAPDALEVTASLA